PIASGTETSVAVGAVGCGARGVVELAGGEAGCVAAGCVLDPLPLPNPHPVSAAVRSRRPAAPRMRRAYPAHRRRGRRAGGFCCDAPAGPVAVPGTDT